MTKRNMLLKVLQVLLGGIAGTALALFNNGFGGNLFGCRGAAADGAVAAASIANERYLERKQCADHVQFVNDMWRTSYN